MKYRHHSIRHTLTEDKDISCMHTKKDKVTPKTGHEAPQREQSYSCILSLSQVLEGSGWSMSCPGCFTPGKQTWYELNRRLGGAEGWYGRVQKISHWDLDLQTASCYVDYAILAHKKERESNA
jgi:hypothetical protein